MMRKVSRFIFIPGIVLVLSASIVLGQVMESPKTPPKKITIRGTGTVLTASKDLVSAEGEFKVTFPTTHQPDKNNGVLAEGVTAKASFKATLPGKMFYVRYEDRNSFPEFIEPDALKALYDQVRDSQVKGVSGTLSGDQEIALGDRWAAK